MFVFPKNVPCLLKNSKKFNYALKIASFTCKYICMYVYTKMFFVFNSGNTILFATQNIYYISIYNSICKWIFIIPFIFRIAKCVALKTPMCASSISVRLHLIMSITALLYRHVTIVHRRLYSNWVGHSLVTFGQLGK